MVAPFFPALGKTAMPRSSFISKQFLLSLLIIIRKFLSSGGHSQQGMNILKDHDSKNEGETWRETVREGSNRGKCRVRPQKIPSNVPNKNTFRRNVLSFLHFLDSCPVIKEFLNYDCCCRLADKYLIAMVFIYFQRAGIRPRYYTRLQFFAALCLAHSMEEEDKDLLGEIFPWALGIRHLIELVPYLLQMKLCLWKAIDYRAFVNKYCCQKVMSVWPHHSVWKRKRMPVHNDGSLPYIRHIHPTNHFYSI